MTEPKAYNGYQYVVVCEPWAIDNQESLIYYHPGIYEESLIGYGSLAVRKPLCGWVYHQLMTMS